MKDDYSDIINLQHHISLSRKRMSVHDRAAQFAAFSALTGYDAKIKEAARVTDKKIELSEYTIDKINNQVNEIRKIIFERPKLKIKYFVKDKRKSGGKYVDFIGNIRHIDDAGQHLIFTDDTKINIYDIYEIEQID